VWDPMKFFRVPRNYWASLDHQRLFLDNFGKKLGFGDLPKQKGKGEEKEKEEKQKKMEREESEKERYYEQFYEVSNAMLIEHGGKALLEHYGGSISQLFLTALPEFPWNPRNFSRAPNGYWDDLSHQRSFMDELGLKCGVQPLSSPPPPLTLSPPPHSPSPSSSHTSNSSNEFEKWYSISHQRILDNGGGLMLTFYNGSLPSLLKNVYPEYPWQIWRFPRSIGKVKKDPAALRELFEKIESELGLLSPEDWNRVGKDQLRAVRMEKVFRSREELLALLKERYPTAKVHLVWLLFFFGFFYVSFLFIPSFLPLALVSFLLSPSLADIGYYPCSGMMSSSYAAK